MARMHRTTRSHPFVFGTGRLCLDFVATVGARGIADAEYLAEPNAISTWCRESSFGLDLPDPDKGTFSDALHLREAMYRIVESRRSGLFPAPEDLTRLHQWSQRAALPIEVDLEHNRVLYIGHSADSWPQVLATLARDAVEYLVSKDVEHTKECAGARCTVLFVDRSRTNGRRWCSMNRCGNAAKKTAFRARSKDRNPDAISGAESL